MVRLEIEKIFAKSAKTFCSCSKNRKIYVCQAQFLLAPPKLRVGPTSLEPTVNPAPKVLTTNPGEYM